MIKKIFGIVVIVLLKFNVLSAQSSFEIRGIYSLSSEKLVDVENTSRLPYHSIGINSKKIFNSNLFIQGGVHLRNFGTKVGEDGVIIDDLPSEMGGQSLDIPINVGYYFCIQSKLRLGMSLGVSNGFLRDDYQDHYGYIIEAIPVYNDYLLYFNTSVELGFRLTDNIILDIKPIFQRQINSNYGRSYKQNGIGCQFGINYVL